MRNDIPAFLVAVAVCAYGLVLTVTAAVLRRIQSPTTQEYLSERHRLRADSDRERNL
jgi:hypothetical protein